jgi:hypothetical protein
LAQLLAIVCQSIDDPVEACLALRNFFLVFFSSLRIVILVVWI